MNYVVGKVTKRMDGFKVRKNSKERVRIVLLPFSHGTSSMALLHILDQHIRTQLERTGRQAYVLHVLHVDQSIVDQGSIISKSLEWQYPLHTYHEYMIEDVLTLGVPLLESEPEPDDLASDFFKGSTAVKPADRLRDLLLSLPSPSSRADMINVLRTRLITAKANSLGCEAIVWGSSTTRLAEMTLSETAKGRGFSIFLQTNDGPSSHGTSYLFPMRDLLRKEISTYSHLTSPPLISLLHSTSQEPTDGSNQGTTIDDLMVQYFASVEENYPSIVTNVVRTCTKLRASSLSNEDIPCRICNLPVTVAGRGLHGRGGDNSDANSTVRDICYGCARSFQDATIDRQFLLT